MAMRAGLPVAALVALVFPGRASAEVAQVLSARSLTDRDIHVSVGWQHERTTASVRREYVQPTGPSLINDVRHHRTRQALNLRAEAGVVRDVSFFVGGALVIADDRRLTFDRRGDCAAAPCLETLLRDGILPGDPATRWGLDAEGGGQFQAPSNDVFRGPTRSGLEHLALGVRWAAMNQARDSAKPTWVLGLESRLSVAADQRFDPASPTGNRAVGLGYHQLIVSSVFSRRFGAVEPSVGGWFMEPVTTSSSVYRNQGSPQRRAGGDVGLGATVWENATARARIGLEATGRVEYRLAGLAQSELWEPLSGDARCASDASRCRADIDVTTAGAAQPNSGLVRSPAYGVMGVDAGPVAHLGRHALLRASFGTRFQEGHFLTDGGSGNPVYDVPGRRFRIEGAYSWHVLVNGTARF